MISQSPSMVPAYLRSHIQAVQTSYFSGGNILTEYQQCQANAAKSKLEKTTRIACSRKIPLKLKAKTYRSVIQPDAEWVQCLPTTLTLQQTLLTVEKTLFAGLKRSCVCALTDCGNDLRPLFGLVTAAALLREAQLRWCIRVGKRWVITPNSVM